MRASTGRLGAYSPRTPSQRWRHGSSWRNASCPPRRAVILPVPMSRTLAADKVHATVQHLEQRIYERLPDSSLGPLASELGQVPLEDPCPGLACKVWQKAMLLARGA